MVVEIRADNLEVRYGEHKVWENINIHIPDFNIIVN